MINSRRTIFISDLHLGGNRPLTDLFLRFLQDQEPDVVDAIYILGDLFESWIGDKEIELQPEVIHALSTATKKGLPIYFLHGNRDFLIGRAFLKATGCQLLAEETTVELYGAHVLLIHGDTLCTKDVAYLKARKYLRCKFFTTLFLLLPFFVRKKIALSLRNQSQRHTAATARESMDVVLEEVEKIMTKHQVSYLVHGHTHRPGIHAFSLGPMPAVRMVLGAWHDSGNMLVWHESGHRELVDIPFTTTHPPVR